MAVLAQRMLRPAGGQCHTLCNKALRKATAESALCKSPDGPLVDRDTAGNAQTERRRRNAREEQWVSGCPTIAGAGGEPRRGGTTEEQRCAKLVYKPSWCCLRALLGHTSALCDGIPHSRKRRQADSGSGSL